MEEHAATTEFNVAYIFKENIERVWLFVRDAHRISQVNSDVQAPIILTTGQNTWTPGSECSTAWYGVSKLAIRCVEYICSPDYRNIAWKINMEIGISYTQSFCLYSVTSDNSTLMVWSVIFDKEEELPSLTKEMIDGYKKMSLQVMIKVDKHLQQSTENLYQFESILINANIAQVWKMVTNWKNLIKAAPNVATDIEYDGDPIEVNTSMKIFIGEKKYSLLRVLQVDKNESSSKWRYILEAYEGKPQVPLQEIHITLINIMDKTTHLSFYHQFKAPVKRNTIKSLRKEKRAILSQLKIYLENTVSI